MTLRFLLPNVLRRVLAILGITLVAPVHADLQEQIAAVVDVEMAANPIAGAVVGVWRGGVPIVRLERGFSDLDNRLPISADDHFRIASITKTFTTTRILQLEAAGMLSLSDPISRYVPGLANGGATLRQLGDMTAGFFSYTHDAVFQASLFADPGRHWTPSELVSLAESHGPRFAPGTSWEYSNTNTLLLQLVVEHVTARTLGPELREGMFLPLSLAGTTYPSTEEIPAPFARGYSVIPATGEFIDMTAIHPSVAAGAGAIVSTLDDVRRWTEALARGDLLSPEAQQERLRMNPAGEGYDAYGFGIARIGGWLGHDGVFPLSFQSAAFHDPTFDQTVVILANTSLLSDYHFPDEVFLQVAPLLIPEPTTRGLLSLALAAAGLFLWQTIVGPNSKLHGLRCSDAVRRRSRSKNS